MFGYNPRCAGQDTDREMFLYFQPSLIAIKAPITIKLVYHMKSTAPWTFKVSDNVMGHQELKFLP